MDPSQNTQDQNSVTPTKPQTNYNLPPAIEPVVQPPIPSNPLVVVSSDFSSQPVIPQRVVSAPSVNQTDNSQAQPKNKKTLLFGGLIVAVVLVIAVVVAVASTHSKSHSNSSASSAQSVSINVPVNWKTVDTGLGYTIKAPSAWMLGDSSSSSFNGLNDNTNTISLLGDSVSTSDTQAQMNQSVTVSSQKLTSNSSQAAFDQSVSSLSSEDKLELKAFGVDVSKAKVIATKLSINGSPWLRVTTYVPGQYSTNLYYWDNDHAIVLLVNNQSKQEVQELTSSYLMPMAASMLIKS